MALDDRSHLEEIRNERLHRLRLLEKRQAIEGFGTPPEVIIEIDQTRRELGIVEAAITSPIPAETIEAIGPAGQFQALNRAIERSEQRLSERMDRMEENSAEWRSSERAAREVGQHSYRQLVSVSLVLSAVALAVSLAVAFVVAARVF